MHVKKQAAPVADPAVAAAQAAEEKRAENGQVAQTQMGLATDTAALRRRFGSLAASIGATGSAFTGGGNSGAGVGGTGFGAAVGGGSGGTGGSSGNLMFGGIDLSQFELGKSNMGAV